MKVKRNGGRTGRNGGSSKDRSLEPFREHPDQAALTTDQGVRVDHTDDSLQGRRARADAARGLPPPREDHPLRPRAHPRARRPRARLRRARLLPGLRVAGEVHPGQRSCRIPRRRRRCSCASPPWPARAARPTRCATCAASRPSSTPTRATSTWSATTCPVFFIQDGIKFPDLVHAVKPEPHNEMPQAASAHDTFWDFVSLQPETMHMVMWVMSDRAIPRSYRMMEGFGVHTFRLVNAAGQGAPREVPLEAAARRALAGVGRGAEDRRQGPRLPPPRPVGGDRGRRLPGVRARACRSSTRRTS